MAAGFSKMMPCTILKTNPLKGVFGDCLYFQRIRLSGSPDLTSPCFWSYFKGIVCSNTPHTFQELKTNIKSDFKGNFSNAT
jgi:hypothetical protein